MKFLYSERFQRLSKEGFWVILGQFLAVLGSLFGVRILTGLLEPKVYGELSLGLTIALLVSQIALAPLGNGIMRFYALAVENGDLAGYLASARRLMAIATWVVIGVTFIVLLSFLILGFGQWTAIIFGAVIFALFSGYVAILNSVQNAARHRVVVAFFQGIEPWARFLIATGLIMLLGKTSVMAMFGFASAIILVFCLQYMFFIKKFFFTQVKRSVNVDWAKQIWEFSWPFSIWVGFTCVQQGSDRWALQFFTNTADVGRYAVLFQLGYYPISLVSGMAFQFLAPIFYQRVGDASDDLRNSNVNKLSRQLVILTFGITGFVFLVTFFFHNLIFHIFAAKQYGNVSFLLPWEIAAGGIFAAGQTIALELQSRMKTGIMMWAKIITAVLGVVFNCVGAFYSGISGVVFAGLFFSFVYFLWMVILSKATNA